MISLDVENYCHDCPDFDPTCDKLYAGNAPYLTLVSCENKDRCKNLKKYIEQQIARKEHDEQSRKETQTQAADKLYSPGKTVDGAYQRNGAEDLCCGYFTSS